MPVEEWKPIPSLNGVYEASNLGRIRRAPSAPYDPGQRNWKPGHIRRLGTSRNGYRTVGITLDGQYVLRYVHRLVAEAFFGPAEAMQVNHINGDKTDNRPENLEYVTGSENCQHAFAAGLRPVGEGHHKAKLTADKVREIRRLHAEGHSLKGLGRRFGVSDQTVKAIVTRDIWKHVS